ncbi:hypothetical protein QMZ92_21645 [Streptomyces sp. HNM0645]|uniref:hypothetical protein n=1 Tax=Streptomyces sp. HNM0645 TaxID=2782343 RepID=UPI0024B84B00|nr:hypothetical protein [Streptomyces sp. HNM0645]MDI9886900.1 hypothetical protein [Streptomyces sp. HNM0645]
MPAEDELAKRRYDNLVDRLENLMKASLKPGYQGYHGQLVLSSGDLEEMGELKDVRRAAREAGRRLGWQPKTHVVDARLFVYDDREVPKEISELAARDAADAIDAALRRRE